MGYGWRAQELRRWSPFWVGVVFGMVLMAAFAVLVFISIGEAARIEAAAQAAC